MRRLLACGITVALVGIAYPVLGHVTSQPETGTAGSYFNLTFTVPHGCDGSPTVSLRIRVPEGVTGVKPQMKAGWNVTIKMRKLDPPMKGERGQTITETVDEVDWRGGPLPANLYDTFGLAMKLPENAGQTLYFPAVQECEKGANRWIQIPAAGQSRKDLREPAPALKLTPKSP